jgi:tetratricopeptide (TPR) repeat protein
MSKKRIRQAILGAIVGTVLAGLVFAQQQPQLSAQMQEAMELAGTQKWAEAAKALDEITRSEPNNARAWFLLGVARHQLGQYAKAVEAYEKNIPISKNPTAMYNLACAYSRQKQPDKAFEWLEKAIAAGIPAGINLETDDDLNSLKTDARFKKTVDSLNKKIKPCLSMPEARQFDFWIGEWDVYPSQSPTGQGPKVGASKIDNIAEGCALLENWTSTANNGKSINYYDANTGKWYQFWMGSGGSALRYEGSFKDNAMRFEGETIGKDGRKTLNRLTFFKIDDNTVRQFAELSSDNGKTWSVGYDFRYVRKAGKISVVPAKGGSMSSTVPSSTEREYKISMRF